MRIVVICEGKTEAAIKKGLREYVQAKSENQRRIGIDPRPLDGPTIRKKLDRIVRNHLAEVDVAGVVAITDVYPDYKNANEAKDALRRSAGELGNHRCFRAHAAQFDIEAWLLPHWDDIAKKLGVKVHRPGVNPEQVNGHKPPSHHFKELFRRARDEYDKVIDGARWLTREGLEKSAQECTELKLFLNSLLDLAGGPQIG